MLSSARRLSSAAAWDSAALPFCAVQVVTSPRATSRRNLPGSPSHAADEIYSTKQLDKIAARWDARAAKWDRALRDPACHLNEDESYQRFLQQCHRLIDRRRRFCASHGVIDVGCGTGLVLADVISCFAWGIGIDISERMIQRARRKHINNARFILGDCFDLTRMCPPAGMILSRGILLSHYGSAHGPDLMRSLRAALLPKGVLLIDFLNSKARARHEHAPDSKAYFEGEELRQMARAAGFRSARITGEMERRVLLLFAEL